ncbi:hypothetical protein VPNG_07837 [Cytospora leucostoma]|uniref:CHAT domain-containing protein n=1 Tax=Cytospora leucostoma TaxID=1230097 RepID=A0A423WGV4_9PEZI|nr:hypothetical protein VPNG_07837 [Cytospora leucostoma]
MDYLRTGFIEELEEAVNMFREAASATSIDEADRATYLSKLGHALGHIFEATQKPPHLEDSICVLRQAFKVVPRDSAPWPIVVENLGIRLGQRYDHTQAEMDLNEAIKMSRAALQATSPDDPVRVNRLHNLSYNLNKRYLRLEDPVDLDDAITFAHEAVDICPPGAKRRAEWFTNLGNLMTNRYALTRRDAHLEEAIQMLRKGLQASPENPHLAIWLTNLVLRLSEKYARSGDPADLEEITELSRRSIEHSSEGDPERINRQIQYASLLFKNFDRTGALENLEQALAIFQEAVSATPSNSPEKGLRLNSLGQSFAERYDRTNAQADLDQAISTLRKAVDASEPGTIIHATALSNLGNSLSLLYRRTRSMPVLKESIRISQEAVEATPTNHPAMAERLANLSLRLKNKFLRTRDIADLNEAVHLGQKSVEAAPPEHPILAACFNTAGIAFHLRYEDFRDAEDFEQAKDYFIKALSVSNTSVSVRVQAGRRFLAIPNIADDPRAYDIARSTIDLIPLLAPRSLQDTDKRHLLSDAVGMASDAAAIALQAGKGAEAAIQCLETGRGVIAGASFEQRDVSRLMREHRDLALSFVALRDRLDRPTMQDAGSSIRPEAEDIDPMTLAETDRRQRQEAQQQLLTLLDKIRSMDGFNRFLLPATDAEMRDAAIYGPIVIVNVSSHRCDALVIEQTQIRSIPLKRVSQRAIIHRAMQLESVDTLKWLWYSIVSPVLVALGFTASGPELASSPEWRRVWWIPTGHLTKFPLHAAGDHLGRSGETTLDRVVSSYSASVRTIIHGRRQQYHSLNSDGDPRMDLVVVSMSETAGQTSLQNADREVEEVLSVFDSSVLQHRRPQQYKKDVLSALDNCKIFHFAGHGSTHPTDPLQSKLLLKDWQQDPLTVSSLLQADFGARPPFLAYLSACGTGQIRNEGSMDENIHLANAFQLAGVRHVVGTLWQVEDEVCVQIARRTYEFIRSDGIGDESVSRGLHHALRMHRDQWVNEACIEAGYMDARGPELQREAVFDDLPEVAPRSPYWVAYIHFGV